MTGTLYFCTYLYASNFLPPLTPFKLLTYHFMMKHYFIETLTKNMKSLRGNGIFRIVLILLFGYGKFGVQYIWTDDGLLVRLLTPCINCHWTCKYRLYTNLTTFSAWIYQKDVTNAFSLCWSNHQIVPDNIL